MSFILALLIDRLFGEPPALLHPVVWVGRYLGAVGRRLPTLKPASAFLAGAALWLLGASVFTGVYYAGALVIAKLPTWLALVATALLLKPLLSLRMLLSEVRAVEASLAWSLQEGRKRLSMIVSRDTSNLSAEEVRESALESLSENLSDSVVAPLFWFALLGLPGAALYRFSNTADAMWGYRGKWEWAGKWAARVDDCLNLVPARVTALLVLLAARCRPSLFGRLPAEARRTPSPNSGWPMSALALALGARLRKPGVYALNGTSPSPTAEQFSRAFVIVEIAAWAGALACLGLHYALGGALTWIN